MRSNPYNFAYFFIGYGLWVMGYKLCVMRYALCVIGKIIGKTQPQRTKHHIFQRTPRLYEHSLPNAFAYLIPDEASNTS